MSDTAIDIEEILKPRSDWYQEHPRYYRQGIGLLPTEFRPEGVAVNACYWCGKPRTSNRKGNFCAGIPQPLTRGEIHINEERAKEGIKLLRPLLKYACGDAFFIWAGQRPRWQCAIMQRDGWKCLQCELTPRWTNEHGLVFPDMHQLHIDHIHPIAQGGKTEDGNLQTLCVTCNLRKGAKIQ